MGRGPHGPRGSLGVLGRWANGAVGCCSAAIPNGKPFRLDAISIATHLFHVSPRRLYTIPSRQPWDPKMDLIICSIWAAVGPNWFKTVPIFFFESEATTTKCKDSIKNIPGVVQPRFRKNGVTTELPQPVTRFRINGFARNVFSLKRSYYGVTPTRDTSLNKWVCPQRVWLETELLRSYSHL